MKTPTSQFLNHKCVIGTITFGLLLAIGWFYQVRVDVWHGQDSRGVPTVSGCGLVDGTYRFYWNAVTRRGRTMYIDVEPIPFSFCLSVSFGGEMHIQQGVFWFPAWCPIAITGLGVIGTRWARKIVRKNCCGKCGYDLSQNTSGTCPECGVKIPGKKDVSIPS